MKDQSADKAINEIVKLSHLAQNEISRLANENRDLRERIQQAKSMLEPLSTSVNPSVMTIRAVIELLRRI